MHTHAPKSDQEKAAAYIRTFSPQPEQAADLQLWVNHIYEYAENEARDAVDWYTRQSKTKKAGSLTFRYLAILFGGLAGLLPILFAVLPADFRARSPIPADQASLFVSLLIGIVALLIAIDRFGDFSAGWMRYMVAAFNIRKELQDFRLEWARQTSELRHPVEFEDVPVFIDPAKRFLLKLRATLANKPRSGQPNFHQTLNQRETEVSKKLGRTGKKRLN